MTVNMAIPKPLNADGIFMVGVQPDKIQIVCKKAGTDVSSLTVEKKDLHSDVTPVIASLFHVRC